MKNNSGIKIGDEVRFMMGPTLATGTVIEDRGPIGHKGRRLYPIRYLLEAPFVFVTEMPAEEFEVVRDAVSTTDKS